MRYADPSANRDLLGNRTLLFIFICAFALVTLLQQILYGRNYIKRSGRAEPAGGAPRRRRRVTVGSAVSREH
ncbi:hypothetical protein MC885_015753 [Smutsia gigantea]|nr:hypothetical protein MC885_015753 [Smutsia gigantea]